MAKRKAQRTAKRRSGTKTRSQVKRTKPTAPNTRAKSKQDAVLALLSRPQGATIAAMIDRLAVPFGAWLSGRRGAYRPREASPTPRWVGWSRWVGCFVA